MKSRRRRIARRKQNNSQCRVVVFQSSVAKNIEDIFQKRQVVLLARVAFQESAEEGIGDFENSTLRRGHAQVYIYRSVNLYKSF